MPLSLKSFVHGVLRTIPLSIYRAVIKRDTLVLLYHVLGPPDLPHIRHLYSYKSAEAFEQDLSYLTRHFRMVACEEIGRRSRSGRPAAHVTFDDGYAECSTVARPILSRWGVPCSFFVTTDFIDNRRMFHRNKVSLCIEAFLGLASREASAFLDDLRRRWGLSLPDPGGFRRWILSLGPSEEHRIDDVCARLGIDVTAYLRERRPYLGAEDIRRLAAEGFTIGAHARRHVPLGSLPAAAMEEEITGSCATIMQLIDRRPIPFAFPHSADGVDRARLRRLVSAHASVGLLFGTGRLRREDEIIVNRITADAPPVAAGRTNLPGLLHAAYRDAAAEALRHFTTAPPGPPAMRHDAGRAGRE